MSSLFSLLVFGFFVLMIFAHSWGFLYVYQRRINESQRMQVFGRGAAAGWAGWFWLCFGLGVWNWKNSGSWMLIIWIYGLLLVPAIGMAFTLIFWWFFKRLPWRMNFWRRALSGVVAGVVAGLTIGFYLSSKGYPGQNVVFAMLLLFGTMGFTSGIMAGESKIDD